MTTTTRSVRWEDLTADDKREMRREAREAWLARERERRGPWKRPSRAKPRVPVVTVADPRLSDACDTNDHGMCWRSLTCTCACHERRDDG